MGWPLSLSTATCMRCCVHRETSTGEGGGGNGLVLPPQNGMRTCGGDGAWGSWQQRLSGAGWDGEWRGGNKRVLPVFHPF